MNHSLTLVCWHIIIVEVDYHGSADVDPENSTSASTMDGVVFNQDLNLWVPDPSIVGMTNTALPPSLPEEGSPWVFKRCTTAEYVRSRMHVYSDDFPENNMIIGDPCYPKQVGSCICGLPWSSASLSLVCWFTLRTSVGAVARRRYVAVCKCKQCLHWNPSAEYIHAISLQEGGTTKYFKIYSRCVLGQFKVKFGGGLLLLTGGWELVYDYFTHITGEKGKFSGVPMHVGHYRDAMEARIQANNPGAAGFFSARKWRTFIHSALALRMASLPATTREPCCDLRVIGGDGTGIGIPLKNAAINPAWAPPQPSTSALPRGSTIDRCGIGPTDLEGTASDFIKAREFLSQVTSRATSVSARGDMRDQIDDHVEHMPTPVFNALEMFLILDQNEPHWRDVQCILSTLSHTESLTGIISIHMLADIQLVIKRMRLQSSDASDSIILNNLSKHGMGPEIGRIFRAEMSASMSQNPPHQRPTSVAFANLFEYIGDESSY